MKLLLKRVNDIYFIATRCLSLTSYGYVNFSYCLIRQVLDLMTAPIISIISFVFLAFFVYIYIIQVDFLEKELLGKPRYCEGAK